MEWYQWLTLFGFTALFGAILVDIYTRVKQGSKKIVDLHKKEKEQNERELIADVVKEVMSPSCSNLELIKDKLVTIETEVEGLKPIKDDVIEIKKEISNITNSDIPLLKCANRDSLRNQLLVVFRQCEEKGYRTTEDIRNFEYMFDSYKKLGGNSFMINIAEEFSHIDHKLD